MAAARLTHTPTHPAQINAHKTVDMALRARIILSNGDAQGGAGNRQETAMSIAEQIAEELGNDGARWETDDGRNVEEIFAERCVEHTSEVPTRYTFADGSYIVAANSGWWTDEDDRAQETAY